MTDLATKFSIPKLNERNYDNWRMLVETACHSVMGYAILTVSHPVPPIPDGKTSSEDVAHYKIFYTVLSMLVSSISEPCLYIIRNKSSSPFEVWNTLREHFRPSTNRNVIRLRGNFYRTSLNNFSSMAKDVDSINTQAATDNSLVDDIHSRVSIKSGGS